MTTRKYKTGKIRERNREKILAAAEQEFVLHGFKGTTMQAVADRAEVPKANIHYYFKSKSNLYIALLEHIMGAWNEVLADLSADDDPAEMITRFIRTKMQLSYTHPNASKIFAMEIIQGAPRIRGHMAEVMLPWVKEKTSVMQSWIDQGKMRPIDPTHLIFMIWATTQHYADFETQVLEITNKRQYAPEDIDHITGFLLDIILTGCGLENNRRTRSEASTPQV
ncbi:MAG TPA: TetR/AcrR family transcriptional regulator [Oceanospirillales bacterium]|nr:TetR family transcriptional regulator [Oceanospirillaceae bacterium]HBS43079.1 TetR/AcrR family transcriptional regulator [Oceanospirillales bacterium]|tara:strand:- start:991 stop:1659 length:669 start_codon:yes stop_codon:yes gene_type:complete